jgi:hypothetical protein
MKNITYLFGAGASIGALPIVKKFRDRMIKFIEEISKPKYELPKENFERFSDYDDTQYNALKSFITDLQWLTDNLKHHASVDTFAKKLFLQRNENDLLKLKATLSAYLIFEQVLNPIDLRYDSFFASILNSSVENLPKHIKILSWNYDIQIEKTYSDYLARYDMKTIRDTLNIVSKNSRTPINQEAFCMIKLNGSTSVKKTDTSREYHFLPFLDKSLDKNTVRTVIRFYMAIIVDYTILPSLSFAWERDDVNEESIVDKAIKVMSNTNILIAVGYSFPFFNRQIDREIIGSMNNLEKIYIQTPDADKLKERFESIRPNFPPVNIIPKSEDLEQFFLPNEL